MREYFAVGLAVVAGAALFEAALVPGVVIGGAAILAPRLLPGVSRRLRPLLKNTTARSRVAPVAANEPTVMAPRPAVSRLAIKRAVAKTITFRIIVTTLDFTANFIVLGELATAAGLSAFSLVAGPVFYLAHETAWNYFGPARGRVDVPLRFPLRGDADAPPRSIAISRALAKTITFRIVASAAEFTATYVVVGDLLTAAGLSAFGLVLGPFVYYGHEWVWDYYDPPTEQGRDKPAVLLLAPPDARRERPAA